MTDPTPPAAQASSGDPTLPAPAAPPGPSSSSRPFDAPDPTLPGRAASRAAVSPRSSDAGTSAASVGARGGDAPVGEAEAGGVGRAGGDADRTDVVRLASADEARDLGRRLAADLRAGDVVLLTGELGAGKTTLTQGIADGLGVRGPITSPTFVIARVHPSLVGGPVLVHADAYRLQGALDLEALDLDADLDRAVTVVEWGRGLAEELSEEYLEIELTRAIGEGSGDADDGDVRTARLTGHGRRWA